MAKVRYRQPEQWATARDRTGQWKVVFDESRSAPSPGGQSVVLDDGDRVLGGGTIDSVK